MMYVVRSGNALSEARVRRNLDWCCVHPARPEYHKYFLGSGTLALLLCLLNMPPTITKSVGG